MKVLSYQTIGEKAAEWGVSSGHIQYLCKRGNIDGAVKRGGVWFIPDTAPVPIKNTKSGTVGFKFVGTKNKVFNSAIKLFMTNGFDNVSIKDIADEVGVKQSTIYNHFKSKQEILDTIYDFYCHYYLEDRPSLENMKAVVQNQSPLEIINSIRYLFKEEYFQQMSDITKIVFQRIGTDSRAAEIGKSLMLDEGIKYVEDVFKMGIACGRFAPFDTHIMATLINAVRLFALFNWIVDPSQENMIRLAEDEQVLYQKATSCLTDLKAPDQG